MNGQVGCQSGEGIVGLLVPITIRLHCQWNKRLKCWVWIIPDKTFWGMGESRAELTEMALERETNLGVEHCHYLM